MQTFYDPYHITKSWFIIMPSKYSLFIPLSDMDKVMYAMQIDLNTVYNHYDELFLYIPLQWTKY